MSRLIDADALLEGRKDHEMISTHLIWNAPTIEAEPVRHAKFIPYRSPFTALCSGCKTLLNRSWKYCPNCGARME